MAWANFRGLTSKLDYLQDLPSRPFGCWRFSVHPCATTATISPTTTKFITDLSNLTPAVTATIGGQTASVSFAGLAPDFVGLWQVNIVVPTGLTQGDYPLAVTVAGRTSNAANASSDA
jgi:uncharacterized protein (TIGR03437 family)